MDECGAAAWVVAWTVPKRQYEGIVDMQADRAAEAAARTPELGARLKEISGRKARSRRTETCTFQRKAQQGWAVGKVEDRQRRKGQQVRDARDAVSGARAERVSVGDLSFALGIRRVWGGDPGADSAPAENPEVESSEEILPLPAALHAAEGMDDTMRGPLGKSDKEACKFQLMQDLQAELVASLARAITKTFKGLQAQQNKLASDVSEVRRSQEALDAKVNGGFQARSEAMEALRKQVAELPMSIRNGGPTIGSTTEAAPSSTSRGPALGHSSTSGGLELVDLGILPTALTMLGIRRLTNG